MKTGGGPLGLPIRPILSHAENRTEAALLSERVIQSDLRSARKPFRFKSDWGRANNLNSPTIIALLNLNVYRAIYFLPMVAAPAAVAMVWKWIFNAEAGILNQFLGLFGIGRINWLSDPNTALLSCAIIGIWSAVGYDLVLILAGLQSIPTSYY